MTSPLPPTALSVNALAAPLVEALVAQAERLRLAVHTDATGVRLIDAGLAVAGSLEAGLAIGEICLGIAMEGLAEDIIHTVHAHPTMHEAIHEAALATEGRVIHG